MTASTSFRFPGAALAPLLILALLPNTPFNVRNPSRDAGVFLYVGSTILHHGMPYRDVWDHKPLAIYYVNALGLLIGFGSPWGVFALETLALSLATALGFSAIASTFGGPAALFAGVAWLSSLILTLPLSGNLTEEFALPFQFAALWLYARRGTCADSVRSSVMLGIAGAITFLFKPNAVGLWIAILACWSLQFRWRQALVLTAGMGLGAGSVLALVATYLGLNGALSDCLDQVFNYNASYSASSAFTSHLWVIPGWFTLLAPSGSSVVSILSWITAVVLLVRDDSRVERIRPFLFLLLLDLPIELFLVSLPGQTYEHYYAALLPVTAGLCGFFASLFFAPDRRASLLWVLAGLMLLQPGKTLLAAAKSGDVVGQTRVVAARYVEQATEPQDLVLMWGAETSVNFLSARRSPTRYVYQYPLYMSGYATRSRVEEFLSDLRGHPPALIVDASATNSLIPPINVEDRRRWSAQQTKGLDPSMNVIFEEILRSYQPEAEIRPLGWIVYRRTVPS